MKRLFALITAILLIASTLTSCGVIEDVLGEIIGDNGFTDGTDTENSGDKNDPNNELPDEGQDENGNKNEDTSSDFLYNAFTKTDKQLLNNVIGMTIPFAPNNEYCLEEYSLDHDDCYEVGVNFYTYGNTATEFEAYKALFSNYSFEGSEKDEYGDTWYYYTLSDGVYVDMCYYSDNGEWIIDVYAYILREHENEGESEGNVGDGNEGGGEGDNEGDNNTSYLYTDFTSAEKNTIKNFLGGLIPFVPNNEYYVEVDYDSYYECDYLAYYTFGNSEADFQQYLKLYSDYQLTETFEDEEGDTWYCYESELIYVELAFYYYEGDYVIDVYAYPNSESGGESGDDNSGSVEDGESNENYEIITNEGAGLPEGTNGIYDIDFTKGKYVKDVSDQGYYLDGCPTTGSPKVLVIPIQFSDATASSRGCSIENILKAFCGEGGSTDYYSVDEYYYISSYGKLDLDITVIDQWFTPKYNSSYYESKTDSDGIMNGDQIVMDEALQYLSGIMDLSDFDSDGNGIIDAVVMINTLDIDEESDFNWAYRYWNYYTDNDGYYYEYDGVSANDYLWASYFFMHESFDEEGYADYSDRSVMNTYTFIHEFGHILGADDYYNTSSVGEHPMDGCDVMDSMHGDHNPYSKFNFGWITTSRLVTTDTSITLTLNSFTKTGDTIIIANNWDDELSAYQEYYVIIYYTMDGLNGGDYGYFAREGIVVYHINASLYREVYEGETYYDVYNNNTDPSDEYGSENNLVEFVKSDKGNFTYVEGDSLPSVTDDQGNSLIYSFTVDSIEDGKATITFTKN